MVLTDSVVVPTVQASVLAEAPDDEVLRMLCEVRGIGKWTVQMFEIWSLRRADILPAADLGKIN
jgi:3-methyladenine DNA glycosylase/8-oxoguanine DNA glycosylase